MVVHVLVCGGGNGAHCYAGIAASQPAVEVRVLTLYSDEAHRWSQLLAGDDLEIKVNLQGSEKETVKSRPVLITKQPAECAKEVDLVVFTVPAFAHGQYLEALKPYVRPGWVLASMPGQAGFELQVRAVWGADLCKSVTIMAFESLPWACRLLEFGRKAEVLGVKNVLQGAINKGDVNPPEDAVAMLQRTMGQLPRLKVQGHILGMTLMGVNAYIHPCILYEHWKTWDGTPIQGCPPLIYQEVSQEGCDTLSRCSEETLSVARAVTDQYPDVDLTNVEHILAWMRRSYSDNITDPTTLYSCFRTNSAYKGLKHPVKINMADNTYILDTGYRYLTEDIPYGLAVLRGIAEIVGVSTPVMDKVLTWGQQQLGKEYLVEGFMKGKDVASTRCPQTYGITSVRQMLGK